MTFRICIWLLLDTYHLPFQRDQYYFDLIDKTLDVYTYEKLIIVGVFECDLSNIGKEKIQNFIQNFVQTNFY